MKKLPLFLALILCLLLVLGGCHRLDLHDLVDIIDPERNGPANPAGQTPGDQDSTLFPGKLSVHFLDVGQGDAILILFPRGQTMLVDAGTDGAAPMIRSYLKRAGVERIDYLVATHPHHDHIGGMSQILRSFEIGQVFMPRATHSTATYKNLLQTIKAVGKKITTARAGVTVLEEEDLKVGFVAPVGDNYERLNNFSAVVSIEYGSFPFLLTGDAEAEAEWDMIDTGLPLKAHVLKVGHHGSVSSTTAEFLEAVSPTYAVISAGAGNDYGHPHRETLDKLARNKIITYRTDRDGTIVFISDGETITVRTSSPDENP